MTDDDLRTVGAFEAEFLHSLRAYLDMVDPARSPVVVLQLTGRRVSALVVAHKRSETPFAVHAAFDAATHDAESAALAGAAEGQRIGRCVVEHPNTRVWQW